MNRRNFIGGILAIGAGFMVLPGAGRIWKAVIDTRQINPQWITVINPSAILPDGSIGECRFTLELNEDNFLRWIPVLR